MRILQIVPTLGYGGVAQVVLNYYEKLYEKGYVFDFITHGKEESFHEGLIKKGSHIYYCETIGKVGIIKYFRCLKRIVNNEKYDIIHIHVGHLTGVYALMIRLMDSKKIICHAHTTKCVNKKHAKFMFLFRKLSVMFSDKLIACGKDAGTFCFGRSSFVVLNNGLDYKKFKNISESEIEKVKAEIGVNEGSFIIGHVGIFSTIKNQMFIVKMFEEVHKRVPNTRLILVGEGELKKEIEEYVMNNSLSESVHFLGVRNDVYTLMKIFNVFVLPSLQEALPVVAIEAQVAGTRCILNKNIDSAVDLGLGLISFSPINQGYSWWVDQLVNLVKENSTRPESCIIYEKLVLSGFEINSQAKELEKIYYDLTLALK